MSKWKNDKIEPGVHTKNIMDSILFKSVRLSTLFKSRRKRQCYKCHAFIEKGENYIQHQYRYDKKIVSLFFHKECFKI
ncbi:MAG: hypothetical protein ACOC1K_01585 [Nanoarchaeota archaeon]